MSVFFMPALLSHKISPPAKISVAATVFVTILLSSCVTRSWGPVDERVPLRATLLDEIESGRDQGRILAQREIDRLFPDRESLLRINPAAALAAERGELEVASTAWWGWDARDAAPALQKAFHAPVSILVVPRMEGPWLTGPLQLDGPRRLLLEPGAEIRAAEGAFLPRRESLITLYRSDDVQISGYGATLSMRKRDYTRPPYEWSQWRHALALLESRNVVVEGLTISTAGGDGVYIGQKRGGRVPENILLTDLWITDNFRQGVSVISVDGFRMESSYIAGTSGTPPGAAIDFEPNKGLYGLTNCVVSASLFEQNAGAALTIHLPNMNESHPPVSIRIEDTLILGNPLAAWIRGFENGVRGSVEFHNSRVEGIGFLGRSDDFTISR